MLRIALALLCMMMTSPAIADIGPYQPDPTPPAIMGWIERWNDVIRAGDPKAAEALVDPRGWRTNLTGPNGLALADFAAESVSKQLRIAYATLDAEPRPCFVINMMLFSDASKSPLPVRSIALVLVNEGQGWRLLAQSASSTEARALETRYNRGLPLAPNDQKEDRR